MDLRIDDIVVLRRDFENRGFVWRQGHIGRVSGLYVSLGLVFGVSVHFTEPTDSMDFAAWRQAVATFCDHEVNLAKLRMPGCTCSIEDYLCRI